MTQENHSDNTGNNTVNILGIAANGRVISYNASEGDRPDGIKVRFKIRIATGRRAREIDARQAKAIMEVLQWQRQHNQHQPPRAPNKRQQSKLSYECGLSGLQAGRLAAAKKERGGPLKSRLWCRPINARLAVGR